MALTARAGPPHHPSLPAWLSPAAILALAIASHLPLLVAGYVQDDHLAVESNPVVERASPAEIFSSSYWKGAAGDDRSLYRPVTILSYAWERRLVGRASPGVSHAVNIVLHALVAWALYRLALKLGAGRFGAMAAGTLMAVLPAPTEAVANVVGRAELLAALFTLLSLLALARAGPWDAQDDSRRWRLASWGAAVLLFLAIGSKENALMALPLMVLLEILFRPRPKEGLSRWLVERASALAPSLLAVVVYGILRTRALEAFPATQTIPAMDNPLTIVSGVERISTALALLPRYLLLLLYPRSLANDYSGPSIPIERSLLAPLPLLGLSLLVLVSFLVIAPLLRPFGVRAAWSGRASFAASLFLLPYLVIGNLVILVGAVFAERFLYLPALGFCLGAGLLLAWLSDRTRRSPVAPVALALVLAAFGMRTVVRCLDWRDDETVFAAAARVNPKSPRANYAFGKETAKKVRDGRADRDLATLALRQYDIALRLWPEYTIAWYEKGALLGQIHDLPAAEASLREALRLNPAYASAHFNLGVALHLQKRTEEAEHSLRKAVLWDPTSDRAWAELGHVCYELGRLPEAAEAYRRAIALGRSDLEPRLEAVVKAVK